MFVKGAEMASPDVPKPNETVRDKWAKIAAIDLTDGEPVQDFWSEDAVERYKQAVEPFRIARVPLEIVDVVFNKAA